MLARGGNVGETTPIAFLLTFGLSFVGSNAVKAGIGPRLLSVPGTIRAMVWIHVVLVVPSPVLTAGERLRLVVLLDGAVPSVELSLGANVNVGTIKVFVPFGQIAMPSMMHGVLGVEHISE
jgi:hypothetical protein